MKVKVAQLCLFATPWTVSRPEYWREYPIPSPADLTNPGIKAGSPAMQVDSLPTELSGYNRII